MSHKFLPPQVFPVSKGIKERLEPRVREDVEVLAVQLVPKAPAESRESKGKKERQVPLEIGARRDFQESKESRETKDPREC